MNFLKTFAACLLAIVVGSFVSAIFSLLVFMGIIGAMFSFEEPPVVVEAGSVLHLNFSESISDVSSEALWSDIDLNNFSIKGSITTLDAIGAIESAASDPNIKGIFIDLPNFHTGSTDVFYELRGALERFRGESGKFVVSYADIYGQGGYWLSSLSDVVYMNPYGAFEWTGMSAQVMFYKRAFEKFGVEPEVFRHGKFKSAVEPFLRDNMSDESRLQMSELLGSIWGVLVRDISVSRGVDSVLLQRYADDLSVVEARGAFDKGLVDTLCYRDNVMNYLATLTGQESGKPKLVTLGKYSRTVSSYSASTNKVAVLQASGDIIDVSSGSSPEIVGNKLASELEKLRRDKSVKAVVLRVNSPGGSILAADVIYDQVKKLRAEKPVVVSMGSYAASGGYYISAPADEIIAAPTTLTGSIGVFALGVNVQKGASSFLGLTVESVNTNKASDMGNIFRPMTTQERTFMQNGVDSAYVRFVNIVADGRGMTFERADALAGGRVWSGLQAVDNGLADRVGGVMDAVKSAADKANLGDDYRISVYPKSSGTKFEQLFSSLSATVKASVIENGLPAVATDAAKATIDKLTARKGVQARMVWDFVE